jgi:hypothetical protein
MKIDFVNIRIGSEYKVLPTDHTKRWLRRFVGKTGVCKMSSSMRGASLVFNTHTEVVPFDALQPA